MSKIIYNVTVNVDHEVHDDWLEWMKSKHIPDVMNTGMFLECKMSKIMAESDGGISYAIGYLSPDMETLKQYQQVFAPALQAEHAERYNGKFAAFRTFLRVVEEFKA